MTDIVRNIFNLFFQVYSFKEIPSDSSNILSYSNNDLYLNFIYDIRYNEITVNISRNGSFNYQNLLLVFEKLMTKENNDVFALLKNEFMHLDPRIQKLKEVYMNNTNGLFLLASCSLLIRNYNEIVLAVKGCDNI